MTIQQPIEGAQLNILPETAPFSTEQRAWLNGFFAGLLSLDAQTAAAGAAAAPAKALSPDGDDGETPWHDAPMRDHGAHEAGGRSSPQRRKLFAAMAQQDCGQCGYQCETYSEALAKGEEQRANLCVPGGKDTSRMLKRLLEAAPAAAPAVASNIAAAPAVKRGSQQLGYSREAPVAATFRGAAPICGAGSEKDTRHVVFDISQSGIDYVPGDSFGLMPLNDPALADAVLAAMRAPANFPVQVRAARSRSATALIEDYSLGAAPDMLFELMSYIVGGERRKKLKALAKGQDPDGDATTYDVLKVLETFGPVHPDPEAFLECLEPLQPRLYSISSSPLATPGELHLTVDAVRYDLEGRRRPRRRFDLFGRPPGAWLIGAGLRAKSAWICAASRSVRADHHVRTRHRHRAVPLVPPASPGAEIPRRQRRPVMVVLRPSARNERFLLSRRAARDASRPAR